jgi:hypothetical protein
MVAPHNLTRNIIARQEMEQVIVLAVGTLEISEYFLVK